MNTRHVNKVIVVAVLSGVASMSSVVEGAWARRSDMLTGRICPYTGVVNGKIYAIGGGQNIAAGYLSIVEEHDPATDTWTRKANMPTGRNGHAVSVVNGKIYAIGGEPSAQASISTVEEYDPATDTWTQKSDMPTRRTFLCAAVVNGKIYAIGGAIAGEPADPDWDTHHVEEYDPVTDTWTRKADMLRARSNAAACAVGRKIYLIGGTLGALHQSPTSNVDEYDPLTDTWTRKANMPTARTALSASVVDGKIYAIGGGIWNGSILSKVEKYDPDTDTWTTESDMTTPRILLSTCTVDGKIYAIGGSTQWYPCPGISTVEEYDTGLSSSQPDFNGDGLVDIKDLLRMVESWKQDDPVADVAPRPFGDGVVDAMDLEFLMSYWEQEVDDTTLIAHWALDESEGTVASDSKGTIDGHVFGDPVWEPDGGQVGGAISLDGIDDYIVTSPALNPADGPFSVFAWVQGGAPGQTVISQFNGENWLRADPSSGCLVTELCESGRGGVPLQSEEPITDGSWHRIGFVWDGVYRVIYVNDIPVAEDTQNGLESSVGGLKIGGGIDSGPGTFWSGLIDDIRIYNRAVSP